MTGRKPLDYYLKLQYPFRVDADREGGYVIRFPDLPGCITQADSPSEIGTMAEEARCLWIETEYETGGEIPLPTHPLDYSGRFNLRVPKTLHARLAQSAEREAVSLNQYVLSLIAAGQAAAEASAPLPVALLAQAFRASAAGSAANLLQSLLQSGTDREATQPGSERPARRRSPRRTR